MSFRHKRPKATQQDLGNHIQLCKTNGIGYVPHSSDPQNRQFMSLVRQVTMLHLVAPNGFFPGVVITCGEEGGTGRFPVGEKRGKIGVWRCGLWSGGEGHE